MLLLFALSVTSAQALEWGPRPFSDGRPYSYPYPKTLWLSGERLGTCLALAIQESHKAPSFARNAMNRPYVLYDFSNYLIATPNRRFDYETGLEEMLKQWVLVQPNQSIQPFTIFREALRLHQNQVWNALVTIHQLLRNQARWWNQELYNYNSNNEEHRAFWDKMIDIRGDLEELGAPHVGDHEGSWYRIWGMILYRLSVVSKEDLVQYSKVGSRPLPFSPELQREIAFQDRQAEFVSQFAEWVKTWKRSFESDSRKQELNRQAAVAGSFLLRTHWSGSSTLSVSQCADWHHFLNENPR